MNTNTLIPAFPTWIQNDSMMPGMTLRDYFANNAMLGFIAADDDLMEHPNNIAKFAYEMADKMMEARK